MQSLSRVRCFFGLLGASSSLILAQLLTPLLSFSQGQSTVPLTNSNFEHTELVGLDDQGRQQTFQIRSVELDTKDPQKETALYTIFYRDQQQTWQNLCQTSENYEAKAIALQGSWDDTGTYQPSKNLVSFSCLNGAMAKCVRFGYKPWKTVDGQSLEDHHRACVRMVRADYCGNGIGHTKDGTPINMYDRLRIQTSDALPGMQFEAAWGVDGAHFINHLRWPEDLEYVQRVCPERLAFKGKEAKQTITPAQALERYPNALLLNDSVLRNP
ncbi:MULTISPECIES: ADYC domain-containing protein [Cyanophyceae]|uniref:ADYC domain-containing protein n=1 Tax=Stenomitos frigidus AS-A4 TaxID=2933935 RepID=A0ABV0KT26_9CYAN|nr:ADYC domain-containing protein [Phormidium sp. FACHB-592]